MKSTQRKVYFTVEGCFFVLDVFDFQDQDKNQKQTVKIKLHTEELLVRDLKGEMNIESLISDLSCK